VPFTVTITNPDRDLSEKLRAEWPGILRWMVEGCLAWQRDGLSPPEVVRQATETYLGEEDAIARWVEDNCVTGKNEWCASSLLWPNWQRWATAANERPGSRKSFSLALDGHGYPANKVNGMRGHDGIDLNPAEKPNPYSAGSGVDFNEARYGDHRG
jgi:putative DNA primase/helicase